MESCPTCGAEVAEGDVRCPGCGLAQDRPAHFTQIREPEGRTSWLGSLALEPGPRRARSLALFGSAVAGAIVLGVVVAIVLSATVLPQRDSPPPGAPAESPEGPTVAPSTVLHRVRSGMVGVVASTCSPVAWSGHGTGAVIGPRLVVTAWPTVAQAVSVAVIDTAGRPVPATVQRVDPALGIAVLRTSREIGGRQFVLGTTPLEPGQRWYGVQADRARGADTTITPVTLGRTDATARLGRDAVTGIALTSLPVKDNLGGGAVVDGRGRLLGITAHYPGRNTLVVLDASRIGQVLNGSTAPGRASCATPLGPNTPVRPVRGSHQVLERYFSKINSGDYDAAWGMLAPPLRQHREQTYDGWRSSYLFHIRLRAAGDGQVRADFDSIFAPGHGPKGTTCARWSMVYRIEDGRIAGTRAVGGGPGHQSC